MVPKMALIRRSGGLNIKFYVLDAEKPCKEPRVLAYFASEIRPAALAVTSCKNPKNGKKLVEQNTIGAQSRMRENETPGQIMTNFCTGVGVHDIIILPTFMTVAYRISAWWGVKVWVFPLTCVVALTTL